VESELLNRVRVGWARLSTGGVRDWGNWSEIGGWLTPKEALGLYHIARRLPRGATVVEIGSWKGKSTVCIAHGLRQGTIHAIDPFNASGESESAAVYSRERGAQPLLEQFQENLRTAGVADKVKACPGYSSAYLGRFDAIHFLFIDGDHSQEGCQYDFENFSPAVVPGGYLAFHDYQPSREDLGPTHVVNQRVRYSKEFEFYARFDSLWIARRTS